MKKTTKFLIIFLIFNSLNTHLVIAKDSSMVKNTSEYLIFVDINELTLSLVNKENYTFEKTYPIAIGKKETPSPIGTWQITSKAHLPGPFGGYWLGLNTPWDTFGIHGTNNPGSIGSMASSGCIRMYNYHIKEVFSLVNYDTIVIVYPGPTWLFTSYNRTIHINDKGTDVYLVQRMLKSLGYFNDSVNGIYDYSLEVAVLKYREEHNLPYVKEIDKAFLDSIGLYKVD